MLACWRIPSRVRSWLAMSAAYAVALQLLLVGFAYAKISASSMAGEGFAICHNTGDQPGDPYDNPAQGKDQQSCCVACPPAGFDTPVASAPQLILFRLAADARFRRFTPSSGRYAHDHNPRSSQGPPQLA